MTKIYIPITDDEFIRLSQEAYRNCRHPRDQARHFIRRALGMVDADGPSLEKNNRNALVLSGQGDAVQA